MMAQSMMAVQIHEYGEAQVLSYEEAPRPEPKKDELLIRVHATSVNPADWQIRSGRRFRLKKPFSLILGFDLSGVVEAVGSMVDDFRVGDNVFGMVDVREGGAYAEYVTAPAACIAQKPNSIDHVHTAALPVVALTAWQALFDAGKLSAGQKVLIHAAAGGVGHIAVQLAKWKGAYVIGTASRRNEPFLREIGADEFIDYRTSRFESIVSNVDVVLESVNRDISVETSPGDTLKRSWRVLKKNGTLVSICANPLPKIAAEYGVHGKYMRTQANGEHLTKIADLVDDGCIKPFVNCVLHLKKTRQAHELSQKGHTRGKIVLKVV